MRRNKERVHFRTTKQQVERMGILVDVGEYNSRSEFVRQAVREKLDEETMLRETIDGGVDWVADLADRELRADGGTRVSDGGSFDYPAHQGHRRRHITESECPREGCEVTRFSTIGMEFHLLREHEVLVDRERALAGGRR